jgi:hypothetical protein
VWQLRGLVVILVGYVRKVNLREVSEMPNDIDVLVLISILWIALFVGLLYHVYSRIEGR